jgi:signal transduction histidine kinase
MALQWVVPGVAVAGVGIATVTRLIGTHDRPGVAPLSLFLAVLSTLAVTVAGRLAGLAPTVSIQTVEAVLVGGYVVASLLWIAFVFEYTGRGPTITRRRGIALAGLGALTVASTGVTWGQEIGSLSLGVVGRLSYLSTFFLQLAVFSLGLLGLVLVIRSAVTYDDLSGGLAGVFVVGGLGITLLPVTISLGQGFGPTPTLLWSFLQLSLIVALFAGVEFRGALFAAEPAAGHLARESVLDTLTSPVVVVDRENRLLDRNEAARETFGIEGSRLRRRTLDGITGVTEDTDLTDTHTIRTRAGRREFAVTRSAIDDGDTVIGHAYRFRDVTDRRTREQRLQVLNRITRHNLRNDLDAIRGFAETVRDEDLDAAETERYFDRIESLARGLCDLSASIERSDRLLSDPTPGREVCDLCALAESVVAGTDSDTITVDAPSEPVSIRTDRGVVRLILEELVDNALEHAERDSPTVTVSVRRTDDGGALEVRDDGPGIPQHEREILLEGEESAAMHGTGIGLWLVSWGVTRLGGRLAFDDREPHGSVVTVDLPDHRISNGTTDTF